MADIVNLKQARKEKARREHDRDAAANRRRFGRTKAEKLADRQASVEACQTLDGKRLEPEKD